MEIQEDQILIELELESSAFFPLYMLFNDLIHTLQIELNKSEKHFFALIGLFNEINIKIKFHNTTNNIKIKLEFTHR